MKKIAHVLFSRMVLMILLILLEAAFIYTALTYVPAELLNDLETVLRLFSLVVVLLIVSYSRHLSSDLMWIVLILIAPAGGILVWLFLEVLDRFSSRIYKELQQETSSAKKYYLQSPEIQKKAFQDEDLAGQYRFISSSAGFPIYQNTGFRYYGLGELGWKPMLEDLRNAKEFIFLEYFIIEPGVMWDSIHEILKQKASEGVTVRVMYDDMGSLNTLPGNYWKKTPAGRD